MKVKFYFILLLTKRIWRILIKSVLIANFKRRILKKQNLHFEIYTICHWRKKIKLFSWSQFLKNTIQKKSQQKNYQLVLIN